MCIIDSTQTRYNSVNFSYILAHETLGRYQYLRIEKNPYMKGKWIFDLGL